MSNRVSRFGSGRRFVAGTRHGYGIHSPFAYNLIRHVFGIDGDDTPDKALSNALSNLNIRCKTAGRIERLHLACGCADMAIDNSLVVDNPPTGGVEESSTADGIAASFPTRWTWKDSHEPKDSGNISAYGTADNLSAAEAAHACTLFLASAFSCKENLLSLKKAAYECGGILCVVSPHGLRTRRIAIKHGRRTRHELCTLLTGDHDGMSIESRDMLMIFSDKGLNKQHIKL